VHYLNVVVTSRRTRLRTIDLCHPVILLLNHHTAFSNNHTSEGAWSSCYGKDRQRWRNTVAAELWKT